MSLLKSLKEAVRPPFNNQLNLDQLPLVIKKKLYFIAELYDKATLLLVADHSFPEEIPIFASFASPLLCETTDKISQIIIDRVKRTLPQRDTDFDAHVNSLRDRGEEWDNILGIIYEESPECYSRIINRIAQNIYPREVPHSSFISYMEYIRLMGNAEYEPGDKITDLKKMLFELFNYWILWPSSRIVFQDHTKNNEGALDLSLSKIAFRVGVETANIRNKGKKKEGVIRLNREQTSQTIKIIFTAFQEVSKEQGDTINKIGDRIYRYLKKNGGTSPSKRNIARFLKEKSPMKECFKKEIRGKQPRYFYIGQTDV